MRIEQKEELVKHKRLWVAGFLKVSTSVLSLEPTEQEVLATIPELASGVPFGYITEIISNESAGHNAEICEWWMSRFIALPRSTGQEVPTTLPESAMDGVPVTILESVECMWVARALPRSGLVFQESTGFESETGEHRRVERNW